MPTVEDYYIEPGDDTELPSKINDALDYMNGKADDAVEAVSDYAASASSSANTAGEKATIATEKATEATEAADLVAQSMSSANVYANTADGLSGTTEGDYFSVPSINDDEYTILYRHDSGPTATEIKRYPSASLLSDIDLYTWMGI